MIPEGAGTALQFDLGEHCAFTVWRPEEVQLLSKYLFSGSPTIRTTDPKFRTCTFSPKVT